VDSSQIGIFKQRDEVGLSCFLESHNGGGLEAEISLEILSDFTNETLEREFANKEFGRLLVTSDFTESDSSRAESVRLLDSTGGCSSFAS